MFFCVKVRNVSVAILRKSSSNEHVRYNTIVKIYPIVTGMHTLLCKGAVIKPIYDKR